MHWSPGFFLVTIVPHWMFGWFSYLDEQRAQHEAAQLGPYLIQMSRDTFENWQSELLQLLWQVVGLAYFLDVGSPSSKETTTAPRPSSAPCCAWWARKRVTA